VLLRLDFSLTALAALLTIAGIRSTTRS